MAMVSSGAIALGIKKLGLAQAPKEMALLQAAAAAGQSVLMRSTKRRLRKRDLAVAQVLLTHADLADRTRANNARDALAALLDAKLVPIINENDTVAVEEIRFGDNDMLASMVTPLVSADLLILLSDVEGLLDGKGERVPVVRNVAREARPLVTASAPGPGTGGMASKVEAARRAHARGRIGGGRRRTPSPTPSRASWPAKTSERCSCRTRSASKRANIGSRSRLRPRGALLLDRGAAAAITQQGKSLLPVGILGVRGDFAPGDAVTLLGPDGRRNRQRSRAAGGFRGSGDRGQKERRARDAARRRVRHGRGAPRRPRDRRTTKTARPSPAVSVEPTPGSRTRVSREKSDRLRIVPSSERGESNGQRVGNDPSS